MALYLYLLEIGTMAYVEMRMWSTRTIGFSRSETAQLRVNEKGFCELCLCILLFHCVYSLNMRACKLYIKPPFSFSFTMCLIISFLTANTAGAVDFRIWALINSIFTTTNTQQQIHNYKHSTENSYRLVYVLCPRALPTSRVECLCGQRLT